LGARRCVDAIESTSDRNRNIAPPHQLAFVSRLPACRVPSRESAELLTPPNVAASPFPLPACSRMAVTSTRLSMIRRTSRKVNMPREKSEESQEG